MRTFVIADASKRKAKPVGLLVWQADPAREQGRFVIELASSCNPEDLPLSLGFFAARPGMCASLSESEDWVRSRIVPQDRHNIVEVLQANGLAAYDMVSLLALSSGRSSDDDLLVHEVHVPRQVEEKLSAECERAGAEPIRSREDADGACPVADAVLASVERRQRNGEIHYAYVSLSHSAGTASEAVRSSASPVPAAQRIASDIRAHRVRAGLTQQQLALRAGISQTVLSRVESGKGNPTIGLLAELAAALNSELDVSLKDSGA